MSGIAADVREVEAREESEAAEAAAERAERDAFEQRCVLRSAYPACIFVSGEVPPAGCKNAAARQQCVHGALKKELPVHALSWFCTCKATHGRCASASCDARARCRVLCVAGNPHWRQAGRKHTIVAGGVWGSVALAALGS